MKTLLIALTLSFTLHAEERGCFPENNLSFPAGNKGVGFTEAQFQQTISKFKKVWGPKVKEYKGKELQVIGDWNADKVQAYATSDFSDNPQIFINGGMARHPDMNQDSLMLILCHELGHHLGGAPKAFRGRTKRRSWSSAEGQADYFATSKCMKEVFDNKDENRRVADSLPAPFLDKANTKCNTPTCIRISYAALSAAKMFSTLKTDWENPELSKNDRTKVDQTIYSHPNPQCRLDTFVSGFNCNQNTDTLFDNVDPKIGACFRARNGFDAPNASRPLCWYRPQPLFQ